MMSGVPFMINSTPGLPADGAGPLLGLVEHARKIALAKVIAAGLLCAGFFGRLLMKIGASMTAGSVPLFFLLLPLAIFSLVTYITLFVIYRGYAQKAEAALLPALAGSLGMRYKTQGLTAAQLTSFDILPIYTSFKSRHCLSGAFAHGGVEMSELTITNNVSKDNREHFFGIALLLTMEKPTPKIIVSDNTGRVKDIRMGGGIGKAEMESPEFNAQFRVYAADQVETRVLLTPGFMEQMMEAAALLRQLAGPMASGGASRGLQWSFLGSRLLILLPTKYPLFAPGSLFRPVAPDDVQGVIDRLSQIRHVTEVLKLGPANVAAAPAAGAAPERMEMPAAPAAVPAQEKYRPPADEW